MDFAFTEEQTLLQDTLMRFVQKEYTFEKRLAIQKSSDGYSRAAWGQLAGMGVLGLPFRSSRCATSLRATSSRLDAPTRAMLVRSWPSRYLA